MAKQTHPFDRFKYDHFWEARINVRLLGTFRTLSVASETETAKPTKRQRKAYDGFLQRIDTLEGKVRRAILKYYKKVRPQVLEDYSLTDGDCHW